MANFKVKLGSRDGVIVNRQVHGHSHDEVRDYFLKEGYYVFSVKRIVAWTSLLGFKRKISTKKFINFNKAFRGLVRAGLPIVEGFNILLSRMKKDRLHALLEQVREQLTKGSSLSEAFSTFDDVIPRYYPALLHAGEQSGGLVEVLSRFIEQEERIRKTRKKFIQTLTYPLILIIVGFASLYIILARAMPEFAALYEGSDKELPQVTRWVMAASDFVTGNTTYLLIGCFIAVFGTYFWIQTESGARRFEALLRRVPFLGTMWQLQNRNIFSRTMRLLLAGGIPVPRALEVTAGAVPSRLMSAELKAVVAEVKEGNDLQTALEKHIDLGDIAGEMIRVGEATGTLQEMFEHIAEHGEEASEDYLEMISNLVAPAILLVVGLMIAFLVVAMYLPMFGAYENLGV